MDSNLEVSAKAFNLFYPGASDQVDVRMAADLDQLGGNDSHGAIVGGKGLVQFGHGPADGR